MKRPLLVSAMLVAAALPLRAQIAESIEVRITNVDVVVTDRAGKAVTGLTKDDFELREDGKLQEITNFYEVAPAAAPSLAAASEPTPPGSAAAAAAAVIPPEQRRRVVVFIDDYSLHPHRRNEVFAAIARSFDGIVRPGDEAMLVSWMRGLKVLVPFSKDVSAIREALNRAALSSGGTGFEATRSMTRSRISSLAAAALQSPRQAGRYYVEARSLAASYAEETLWLEKNLVEAITRVNALLGGLDGRKLMIFAGAHLPVHPGQEMFDFIDSAFAGVMRVESRGILDTAHLSQAVTLENAAKAANAAGVTMYMIDAAEPDRDMTPTAASSSGGGDPIASFVEFSNTAAAFASIANITGGIALTGTKNFDVAMETVVHDLGAYYSLGYRSPAGDRELRIHVRVKNRPELRVRARGTYVAKSAEEELKERVQANVFDASLSSEIAISVKTGKPVRASRHTFRVPLEVTIPSSLTLLPEGDQLVGGFTFYVASGNDLGALSTVGTFTQPVRIAAADQAKLRARPLTFSAEVVVREGEHVVSVAVADNLTRQTGFARARVVAR